METETRDPEAIESVRQSIVTVPWERLAHAYHGASDAPANLEVFLSSTESNPELKKSVDWMWTSILHQGSIYSASTPVMWILIDLLAAWPDHPAADAILRGVQTMVDTIPHMEGTDEECGNPVLENNEDDPVYEAFVSDPVPKGTDAGIPEAYFTAACVTQRQVLKLARHSLPVVRAALVGLAGEKKMAAVAIALGAIRAEPENSALAGELATVIGNPDFDPGAWISTAMVLGERGVDFSNLLSHTDRRMRLAAAMSPGTSGDARSVSELVAAVSDPEWLEQAFPSGLAHLDMHPRFHVLKTLLDRTKAVDAEPSVIEALRVLVHKRAAKFTVDFEWGPVLHWAFAERIVKLPHKGEFAPLPTTLTPAQTAILRELCHKADFWDRTFGNGSLAFKRVQLPFDREALRRLAGETKRPGIFSLFRRK